MNQIPPALAPYISRCIETRSLTLLTSVLDTPANWLLVRILLGATNDRGQNGGALSTERIGGNSISDRAKHHIVFLSLYRAFDIWSELARKCNLNLQDMIRQGTLHYINGLAHSSTTGITTLSSLSLTAVIDALNKSLFGVTQSQDARITILLDGLDFLLASQPDITALKVYQLLLDLQTRAHSVVATCAADGPLLHNIEALATPLELEHSNLTRLLAHNAQLVYQLRPLETGQSKEVTGSVRVSKGGAWESEEGETELEDGEWLYYLSGSGTVKVWGRGEA